MPFFRIRREAKLLLLFFIWFMVAWFSYYGIQSSSFSSRTQYLQIHLSSIIINTIAPNEKITMHGDLISSQGLPIVRIDTECDGLIGIFFLTAALFAFPMRLKHKITGMLTGGVFLFLMNFGRIIGLYYVLKYKPQFATFMHIYIGQSLFIFAGVAFFLGWVSRFSVINGNS